MARKETKRKIMLGYFRYWGKIDDNYYHPLVYHCLDVAAVGQTMFKNSPLLSHIETKLNITQDFLLNWLTFLCALHDIGKFSDGFQGLNPTLSNRLQGRKIQANYQEKHWSIGYRFLMGNKDCILFRNNPYVLKYWFSASIGHHGRPPKNEIFPQPLSLQFPSNVKDDVFQFISELKQLFSIDKVSLVFQEYEKEVEISRISWLIAGIVTMSDWIASNENWFPFCTKIMPLQEYYVETASVNASKALTESGIMPIPVDYNKSFSQIFPSIKQTTYLQKIVAENSLLQRAQLFVIEDITGSGKTEAALILAYRLMAKGLADGLYFALPTQATANAMHKRIGDVYKKFYDSGNVPSFVLSHSASKMQAALEFRYSDKSEEDSAKDSVQWISENRKKALFAHVGVGTIDQALLAILQAKHQSLRLFGLSRKVLIVDEVHASDEYMHTLLRNLLKFHAAQGGSVILLSATLPMKMRKELIESFAEGLSMQFAQNLSSDYPLVTQYDGDNFSQNSCLSSGKQKQVHFEQYFDEKSVFAAIRKRLENGDCVCWVRNTVFDALSAYEKAGKEFGQQNIILFHSRFIMESFGPESGQETRQGKLVISTQVIEQSLDIDFDFMVSDLAPIDLIIQRAGRLHRHKRGENREKANEDARGNALMGIFMPPMTDNPPSDWYTDIFPKAAKVYTHHGQLWLTAKWITEHKKFSMPEDARDMIESIYSEDAQEHIPKKFEYIENRESGNDFASVSKAHFYELNLETGYVADGIMWQQDDNAPTRLNQPTIILRLAKKTGNCLEPFYKNTGVDWELSQLSVYASMIKSENPADFTDIETAKKEMPDEGKYCSVIIMFQEGTGWKGRAIDGTENEIAVYYNSSRGLRVGQGGIDELDI